MHGPHSEATKLKISLSKKKNPTRYWLGKKRPDISEKAKIWVNKRLSYHQYKPGHIGIKGEKNNRWKGGITPEHTKIRNSVKGTTWRKEVFAKDNWTCQKCDKRGGNLNAHHIKPFSTNPKLRFDVDNGITLCEKCHKLAHS